MKEKVIVIGLDGGTLRLLKPWMDQGLLPHLKQIESTGISAPLQSSIPPVTIPAWPCFMTGKNPGKHGIHFFFRPRPGSYEEIPINSTSLDAGTLWELLSRDGQRVAVLNVPSTYPPQKVNGVLISDLKMTSEHADLTYPAELLSEIERRFGPYRLAIETPAALLANQSRVNIDYFLRECREILDYKCHVAGWLMDRYDFDFVMLHILETDRLQHWLWNLLDPAHPKHDPAMARRYYDPILTFYRTLDDHIGMLMQKAGPDATIIVMSDHGFGAGQRAVDLATWLLQEGYLTIKDTALSQFKYRLWRWGWTPGALARFFITHFTSVALTHGVITRISKWALARGRPKAVNRLRRTISPIFLSTQDIDWTRTKAFCLRGPGQIRINLKDREPQGIVQRGADYEALVQEISHKLGMLKDPATDQFVNGQVYIKEQVYSGKHLDELPDITFVPLNSGYSAVNLVDFKSNKVMIDDILATGIHRSDGMLLATGKAIKRGAGIEHANIMDLAPTILYLMGGEIPRDMDGKVLSAMFTEEFLHANAIKLGTEAPQAITQPHEVSAEDEEKVLERLRGWGYID
jgi:predicted AlkP superfamily phosphohydrolase/phosphomutase